jgi:hypothetical protein
MGVTEADEAATDKRRVQLLNVRLCGPWREFKGRQLRIRGYKAQVGQQTERWTIHMRRNAQTASIPHLRSDLLN